MRQENQAAGQGAFWLGLRTLFGTTNTQFIHNLRGNTHITRNVRHVTRSVNPKGLAAWTLGDLHERVAERQLFFDSSFDRDAEHLAETRVCGSRRAKDDSLAVRRPA